MTKSYETATDFVLVKPEEIDIAQPADPTAEGYDSSVYQFCNPRGRAKGGGFDKEPMKELMESIAKNGLQLPLLLREVEGKENPQLVAGERRLNAVLTLKKKKKNGKPIQVYNKRTHEMEPVTEVYETIFASIAEDCDDATALSLAVDENEQSQPLTVADQIRLVEELLASGLTPNEICQRLNKNPAWVNHTQHFKDSLPEGCYESLIAGQINRHVATELLKYKAEDREEIWEEAMADLVLMRKKKRESLEEKVEDAAGQSEIAGATATLAPDLGLDPAEAQAEADAAAEGLVDAEGELEDFNAEPTSLTGGDISESAGQQEKLPKTPTAFNKKKIEKHYIDPLREALGMGEGDIEPDPDVKFKDPVTGKVFPKQLLLCSLETCDGIINQHKDVFEVLREFMFDSGKWQRPDEEPEGDGEEGEEGEE